MSHPIKFRAWDKKEKKMVYFELQDLDGMWVDGEYVGESEIMQYTTRKDKNDVEIYEGDIIHDTGDIAPDQIAEVKWNDYGYWEPFPVGIVYAGRPAFSDSKDCEIIGNIYENPELIKGTHGIPREQKAE